MKVLFINSVYGRGSTGRIVQQLGKELEARGDSYMVAYGRGDKTDDPHCYYLGNGAGVYLHAGLSRLTDRTGFYSRGTTIKLLNFVRRYDPDVIHLHNLHGYYLNIELLFDYLKREFRGKVVWTLHDCWAFTGHCVHFAYVGCERWKNGCEACPQKKEYPASWLADSSCRNYADKKRLFCGIPNLTVVTVSQWLKRMAEQSFLKDYPIRCVYNGIDTQVFRPVENHVKHELGIADKKMILLVSDGWNKRKGFDKVLAVAEKSPADWHYVMVGLLPRQIRGLPANITGIERIWNRDKLIEYYSAADVFFNPSVEETFGLVTAEAIACGTPAVVMDSTACPEPLRGYGRVIQPDKTGTAVEAIKDTLAWKKERPEKLFEEAAMLRGYLDLYESKRENSQ